MNKRKLLSKVLSGSRNLRFADIMTLARVSGSHHIMVHPTVPVPLNLQEVGGQAKPYQVRQFLKLIEQYNLALEE